MTTDPFSPPLSAEARARAAGREVERARRNARPGGKYGARVARVRRPRLRVVTDHTP